MNQRYALSVTVPLLAAAAILAARPLLSGHRRVLDLAAVLTSASVAVMLLFLLIRTEGADSTYWFAGFRPVRGVVIGVDLEAGPLSAGLACLGAVLLTASLVFSWRYFTEVGTYFHALMLTFLAGMTGFCLTGEFSTVSHAGMFLAGFALLTPLGLAGAAMYVLSHAFVKAALFLGAGIVLHRLHSVNETWLHGRGVSLRVTGVLFTLAGLALADLPPFGTFLGKGWIDDSAGGPWLAAVCCVCTVLAAGAVLRVAGGVFYGLGDPPGEDPQMAAEANEETGETDEARQRTPLSMIVPTAAMVALALAAGISGLVPRFAAGLETAAVRFQDQPAYIATVLAGAHVAHPAAIAPAVPADVSAASIATGLCSALGAVLLALMALYWRRLPLLRRGYEPGAGLTVVIRRFQSGVINDYVTWIVAGLACLSGVLALIVR